MPQTSVGYCSVADPNKMYQSINLKDMIANTELIAV